MPKIVALKNFSDDYTNTILAAVERPRAIKCESVRVARYLRQRLYMFRDAVLEHSDDPSINPKLLLVIGKFKTRIQSFRSGEATLIIFFPQALGDSR